MMRETCTPRYPLISCSKSPAANAPPLYIRYLPDEAARVGESVREPVRLGHEQQARRLRAVGAHDDRPRRLEMLAFAAVEVHTPPSHAPADRLRSSSRSCRGRISHRPVCSAAGITVASVLDLAPHLASEPFAEAALDARGPSLVGPDRIAIGAGAAVQPSLRAPRSMRTPASLIGSGGIGYGRLLGGSFGFRPACPRRRAPTRPSCSTAPGRRR